MSLGPLIAEARRKYDVPAIGAFSVAPNGQIVCEVVGVKRSNQPDKVLFRDPWHLGSCGKAFTATLIARLIDEGAFGWDTILWDLLGNAHPEMSDDYRNVTIAQLLRHRSGLTSDVLSLGGGSVWKSLWNPALSPRITRAALVDSALQSPPAYAPGNGYGYSNVGYCVAGRVCEVVTGADFEELMLRKVATPLRLDGVGFGASPTGPWPHMLRDGQLVPLAPGYDTDNPPATSPAGTLHMPLQAWAAFARMHVAGARGESEFLSRRSFGTIYEKGSSDDGCGWALDRVDAEGRRLLWHNGSNTLNYALVVLAPASGVAYGCVTNCAKEKGGDAVHEVIDTLMAPIRGDQPGFKK
jgi:CubicO group peptidase (beta-lactamase class C family)